LVLLLEGGVVHFLHDRVDLLRLEHHGSTSSLKIDEIDKSILSIQAWKSQKRDFRHFSGSKVCYSNGNVRFENFMHIEWSEAKFLKGIVGDKRRLRF